MSLVAPHDDSLLYGLFRSASQSNQALLVAMIRKKPMVIASQAPNNMTSKRSIVSVILDSVCLQVEVSRSCFGLLSLRIPL